MKLHVPSGRAGRLWLRHRLATAARGIDLLDRKLRILRQEQQRLRLLNERTGREWNAALAEAETWALRAAALAGERALPHAPPAEITVEWAEVMGAAFPERVHCRFPDPSGLLPLSAAVTPARLACRAAVEAGARHAAAREALRVVTAETATTTTRIRALRERWTPALRRALTDLDLALDEGERAAAVQARRRVATTSARAAKPTADGLRPPVS
ncbi:V-type ATP synthase subunit D [Actinomadura sp. ATCC 31491]|uniref:V-type ATP synthase subunit D n=1 Tax=Actinomadura luzonensis TaxID=2805427 RepID=A0ABT0G128_9ACTN|nr:V-type ATP synthase subunit D [Actinomadura luzonensis]MCK2218315.1 V-type ATP synthase subunit D [Actinomadura luzonensis]